jgi:hypothetical protein
MENLIKVLKQLLFVLLVTFFTELIHAQSIKPSLTQGVIHQILFLDSVESGWIEMHRDDSELLGCVPDLFKSPNRYDLFQSFNDRMNHFYLNSTVYLSRDLPDLNILDYPAILNQTGILRDFDRYEIEYMTNERNNHVIELTTFFLDDNPQFVIAVSLIDKVEMCCMFHFVIKKQ